MKHQCDGNCCPMTDQQARRRLAVRLVMALHDITAGQLASKTKVHTTAISAMLNARRVINDDHYGALTKDMLGAKVATFLETADLMAELDRLASKEGA